MSKVVDAINWDGIFTNILLYAAWKKPNKPSPLHFEIQGERESITIDPFVLDDETNHFPEYSIALYELRLQKNPPNFEETLRSILTASNVPGVSISWMMYDGIFSYDRLFDDVFASSIYGISSKLTGGAILTLEDDIIESEQWKSLIRIHKREFFS